VTSAQDLADLVQQEQTRRAVALEQQAIADADGGAGAALTVAVTAALTGWVGAFGALTVTGTGAALTSYLAGVRRDVARATAGMEQRAPRAIEDALDEAAAVGARHAVEFATHAGAGRHHGGAVAAPRDAVDAARSLGVLVRDHLRLSRALLGEREVRRSGWRGVLAGIGAARQAVATVGRVGAWAVHRAINDGAAQAIAILGADGLWVAEPDACVACLAYSGRLADGDGRFPGGLSLDPRQARAGALPIEGPPRHPHCRCRLTPWLPSWAPSRGLSLPDLLQQQAWRSAATGRARPTESRAARLRAARTLLTAPGVPAGVRHQARTAVAAGHF
jgi:hypothetical protein